MAFWDRLFGSTPGEANPSAPPSAIAESECTDIGRLGNNVAVEFTRSIYLWRCVDMIASMSSSVPMIVVKDDKEDPELSDDQEQIEELLERPNPQWSGTALQYFVAASLAVSSRAFLLRVRNGQGKTLELWPLLPSEVTIEYELNSRMIKRFYVNEGAKGRWYAVDKDGDCDVIFLRRPALNPQTDKSPAAIAAPPAEVYTRILQRCADIVSNSSNIQGVLSTEAELGKKSIQEISDNLKRYTTGGDKSGSTLVTSNARWSLTRLSEDPSSALSVTIKDSIARDVVMTFGVPTQLVGISGTDTYNNLALARVGFLTDTVLPAYIGLYTSGLNQALMREADAKIVPDIDHIPAMMEYQRQLVNTAAAATMLSINEQREMLGYPPYEDEDDEAVTEMANIPVKLEELRLKRLAIEAQGGNVQSILSPQDRGAPSGKPEQQKPQQEEETSGEPSNVEPLRRGMSSLSGSPQR